MTISELQSASPDRNDFWPNMMGAPCTNSKKPRAAEKSETAQVSALAIIAHDFRGPLTNLSVLLEQIDTQSQCDAGGNISTYTRKAIDMIDCLDGLLGSILDRVKLTGDPLAYRASLVNVNDVVEMAMALNQPVAESRSIKMRCYSVEPLTLWGDEQMLLQAIDNLVGNAVKHSRAGQTVILEAVQSGQQVVIRISDEGEGIAALDLNRAFRPFVKLSDRTGQDTRSSGLGLWIVKLIAERHGGRVNAGVAGKRGGAVLTLRLPMDNR